jgi:tetraacyldisaccharide 4'-kinase
LFLRMMSELWTVGGKRKRRLGELAASEQSPVPVPTVSVGGITMGGSGKTPFCDYLAAGFSSRGRTPAILTRGYHRRSPANFVLLPAGAQAASALTGDEAQIFLASGFANLAISTDRHSAAEALLAEYPETDLLLLDDGFQHARMRRDYDVVLIDGLDPFGGEAVFPLGRLREPLEFLQRADAFVITRTSQPKRVEAIRRRLAHYNPSAPVFVARQISRAWREFGSNRTRTLPPGSRVAAFCGLGNPQSFWNTLRALDLEVPFRWTFGDHHQYNPLEVQRLIHQARAHKADFLVTTQKDAVNLPSSTSSLLGGPPLLWLKIEFALTDPATFFDRTLVF